VEAAYRFHWLSWALLTMPLQTLRFKPGVSRESTTLANEGGWFECDKIRFRSGQPEKIGGLSRDTGAQATGLLPTVGAYWGVARALRNWVTLAGSNLLGVGTELKYYIQNTVDGTLYDVTPIRLTSAAGAVTFAASNGSSVITVSHTAHGAIAGDFVTYSGAASLGGVVTAGVLNAEHRVTQVLNSNSYTITVGVTANASDSGTGGGSVVGTYQLNIGAPIAGSLTGWGAGGWGVSGWGLAATSGTLPALLRLWSHANFGENLIINPRGGALYYWRVNANPNIFDRAQKLTYQTFTVTIASPGVVTFSEQLVDGTLVTLSTTGALPTGLTAGSSYYVVNGVNLSLTPDGTPINTSGSQSGTHSLIVTDCPTTCNYVLVSDSSRFVLTFGVNDYGSATLDPLLIRWSDQESYNTWFPQATNQAGSYRLSIGSEIVTAQQTRQEVLVWTDAALYSMQYLGPPYVWGVQPLGSNISIVGPNCVTTAGNVTYWMGVDKFYVYSGQVQPLPCTLRQYVFGDINLNQRAQIFSGTNEGYNEVWWFYCSANSETVDRYVIFNYLENIWYYGTMARTAWLDSALRLYPIAAGYNGQILYHENGVDDGTTSPPSAISAYIQSSDFDIGDGHNYGFVWRIIPDLTFDGSTSAAPEVMFSARPRKNPGALYGAAASPMVVSDNNFSTQRNYTVQQFTQIVYTRIRGRQMAFKISSDSLGTQWQFGAPRLDVRPDGRK